MRIFHASAATRCVLIAAVAALVGCRDVPPPVAPAQQIYTGPLHPLPQILSVLAQRSVAIRTLWSRHDFAVTFRDDKGRLHSLDGDGVLLLRKPSDGTHGVSELRLTGSKDIVGQVFDLGVNASVSWLTLQGDVDTQWYLPTRAAMSEVDPSKLPVRPDLVPDLLGVGDWSTNAAEFPAPVLTYAPETDEYVLTLIEQGLGGGSGRFLARRQFRIDRAYLLIKRITLFGFDGRPVATSVLWNWKQVPGLAAGSIVPGDIMISLPASNASLRFTLRDTATNKGPLPADISFQIPRKPPVSTVIELGGTDQK